MGFLQICFHLERRQTGLSMCEKTKERKSLRKPPWLADRYTYCWEARYELLGERLLLWHRLQSALASICSRPSWGDEQQHTLMWWDPSTLHLAHESLEIFKWAQTLWPVGKDVLSEGRGLDFTEKNKCVLEKGFCWFQASLYIKCDNNWKITWPSKGAWYILVFCHSGCFKYRACGYRSCLFPWPPTFPLSEMSLMSWKNVDSFIKEMCL